MSQIRPLERDDLPRVASLFELLLGSGSRTTSSGVIPYLERTLLDYPWVDPEVPSLVYLDDRGTVVGFIGSTVRRLRFEGRTIRLGCSAHLMADPEAASAVVGPLLLQRYLAGPQDLTITDSATDRVRRIWEKLGGETAYLRCVSWFRVLRPWDLAADVAERRLRRPLPGGAVRPVARALDALTAHSPAARLLRTPEPGVRADRLSPEALLEHLPAVAGHLQIYPDYDVDFLRWLFREVARLPGRGTLRGSVVTRDGRPVGWHLYHLRPRGICRVLQVAARDGGVEDVLDHLFYDAHRGGGAVVEGRMEAQLLEPLSRRHCLLRYRGSALIHSRDPELLASATSRRALLTRLEGEW
jgi:hypothetical protein